MIQVNRETKFNCSRKAEFKKIKNIYIGTKLEVKKKFGFDNSYELKVKNMQPITISEQLAKALFVKPAP